MFKLNPISKKEAIIKGDKWRFTILTDALIRIEYSEDGVFEDRATQVVIDRDFDVPHYVINEDRDDFIKITTDKIEITYTKRPFSKYSFCVKTLDKRCGFYYFDDIIWDALPGTAKTLDNKEDNVELEGSVMGGWFNVLDDSASAILNEDNTVSNRDRGGAIDRYIFAYGGDNIGALRAFYKLTGNPPLLPRFALGNWWSRYHKYTDKEYLSLMDRFKAENIPFSVAVIDMDWHITELDEKYGRGWTGYTWNREYFPDYKKFLNELHERGLKTTLNLHPADGVYAYEDNYLPMAKALGVDYENEEHIEFDICNPKFAEAYFKYLHHPYEKDGVDFWWIDFQQGDSAMRDNVSALWMLNHLHYLDNCRNGKRGIVLSRYAGAGSHRYPIGFSGDAFISWKSLDFQPYFTSTASNIGYTWWSHDIGGHTRGYRSEELQVRWVQLGVFSPIMRLHSAPGLFTRKEPWTYRKENGEIISKFLRLRHTLIPYLYTMNYLTHKESRPLVCPMYYFTKGSDEWKNEYYFGTEMICAPITSPQKAEVRMGSATAYLPEGVWFDFFSGKEYKGGRKYKVYREISDMPVFVRGGGIIPLDGGREDINDVKNPEKLRVEVFPYADNTFKMYEDDGESFDYESGKSATTLFDLKWENEPTLKVKAEGDLSLIPKNREYEIVFRNVAQAEIELKCENAAAKASVSYSEFGAAVKIVQSGAENEITISLKNVKMKENDAFGEAEKVLCNAEILNDTKSDIYEKLKAASGLGDVLNVLSSVDVPKEVIEALAECYSAE